MSPTNIILMVFGGFLLTRSQMGWMLFINYISPWAYALKGLVISEFESPPYNAVTVKGVPLGESYMALFDFPTDRIWQWCAYASKVKVLSPPLIRGTAGWPSCIWRVSGHSCVGGAFTAPMPSAPSRTLGPLGWYTHAPVIICVL
jgi:hypothetical protein